MNIEDKQKVVEKGAYRKSLEAGKSSIKTNIESKTTYMRKGN